MYRVLSIIFAGLYTPLLVFLWTIHKLGLTNYRSVTQVLALIPDWLGGVYTRRLWYKYTLKKCGHHLTVLWLSTIYEAAHIGESCYVGQNVTLGWVEIGDDVLISSNTIIVSGTKQHATADVDISINRQTGGQKTLIHIGSNVWIGAGCLIGANVPRDTVIGMGSVVVSDLEETNCIYAGNPAKKIRHRISEKQ